MAISERCRIVLLGNRVIWGRVVVVAAIIGRGHIVIAAVIGRGHIVIAAIIGRGHIVIAATSGWCTLVNKVNIICRG
ncbi:hypothetical protein GEP26_23405 [Salmonella enterica subsp. enterica serovar Anatum]|uniref:hypothetical protein n=1 Tax=Salmonella enterica TaxID=28901 RepID=UPI001430E4CA|nr:hypothetical protein [Salmonella enterica]NJG46920.1 hypothetical protein [Salmonella enterica subsp. enterica serovar Anatum]